MDFKTSVKTCLTQKYIDVNGRASRSEFWWFVLAYLIGAIVVALISFGLLSGIYALALVAPLATVGFRRLQDTGRPGWYMLIWIGMGLISSLAAPDFPEDPSMIEAMPGTGRIILGGVLGLIQLGLTIVFIYWLTRPSQPETNAYGPPEAGS